MLRAPRVCGVPRCPQLIPAGTTRCTAHEQARARAIDARRGTRQSRGYGAAHDRLRKQWKHKVNAGVVPCARCRIRIAPGGEWHLDHDDDDRSRYLGPSHKLCNLAAAGRKAHGVTEEAGYPGPGTGDHCGSGTSGGTSRTPAGPDLDGT